MSNTSKQICAIDIKRLWYADAIADDATSFTASDLAKLLATGGGASEIENVHQDTWTLEESESSQDSYRNQLTGSVYRMSRPTMGNIVANFTIGRYDYKTKSNLMGGSVILDSENNAIGWERARGAVEIKRMLIVLTVDNVYCVLPYCNFNSREASTDKAIGLATKATAMEPISAAIKSEYWYNADAVKVS